MNRHAIDISILGGGLAGGLIALALAARRPDLNLLLIERGERFGGNHVWSFFASDIAPAQTWLVEPLIAARWDGYCVHFPRRSRDLSTPYHSVTGETLDAALRARLPGEALLTGTAIAAATPTSVTLADGRHIACGGVIDARGAGTLPHMAGGWQKFAGQLLRLAAPHGLTRPIVMDARVEQVDGYRFVYCLPFSDRDIFVEDTYYADGPELDLPAMRQRIAAYAQARQWRVEAVTYEETGVLPVIATGDFEAFWHASDPALAPALARAGARAALVHPLTSYSLPIAVRFADRLCTLDNLSGEALGRVSYAWAREHWRQGRFYRMLTRMLFGAAVPSQRFRVLERFYGLPAPLIERFYAGRSTAADALRILAGKPPVPIGAALASLVGGGRPLAPLGERA
ncbi:lycopene beta-cyclase CrtY [Novosphingobium album (ex Liu et al. 2023)]|uniref:Lycopene beta-cyclase CrtY n=1 Tax=Novosphingobium album (ex Liu et al. 2023) TaxID=3031130 RepID=A0ABT5WJP6_9SPHN|nr:lycopene beta-cyclase CrtY [Novosphingobium album (ex Liu et al. 2023)]MDE8650268.1 lycopene beta-cyclase CrtY [Novosphingobium album (ex Liu et al. 2023)]